MLCRGERLDQSGDGEGIGLSLVSHVARAADGTLNLRNTRPGLLAELRLRHAG